MAITENAKQYHEKMFPGYVSDFRELTLNSLNALTTLPLMKWLITQMRHWMTRHDLW